MTPSASDLETALLAELRRTLARLELALAQISDALVIADGHGEILWCNASFERLMGRSRLQLLGCSLLDQMPVLFSGERRFHLDHLLQQQPQGGRMTAVAGRDPLWVLEIEWRPVLAEVPSPYVFSFHDVSDRVSLEALQLRSQELQDQQLSLAAQVVTCPVTGLPNRRGLLETLSSSLAALAERPGRLAVLFCDLNRFKEVNDTYGHHVGDALLITLAQRMQQVLRPEDVLARLGGDEFVLVCTELDQVEGALLIAERLIAAIAVPWTPPVAGTALEIVPEVSIGIAISDDPASTAEGLLHDADQAMYEAKGREGSAAVLFDTALNQRLQGRQLIRTCLRRNLADRRLELHLQPIVRLVDGLVVGYEALCRPQDGEGRPIDPQAFITEAEAAGLITPLGQLLLERGFAAAAALQLPLHGRRLALNISTRQLSRAGIAAELAAKAAEYALEPSSIALEVTETALIDQAPLTRRELARLREAGFRLILDDFGLGHSSINWLADEPIDGLKIDRSLIAAIEHDQRRRVLVAAIVGLARQLELEVVAEGVETCGQRQLLLELGCDLAQGFLFSSPQPNNHPQLAVHQVHPPCC